MSNNTFYNEVLTYHNMNPIHKHDIDDANFELEGVNPSCGDDIILKLKIDEQGKIVNGGYTGDGCAISQASADMMLDLVIGKPKEEAIRLADIFFRMIKGNITDEELDEQLKEFAKVYGQDDEEKFIEEFKNSPNVEFLKEDIKRKKALEKLVEITKFEAKKAEDTKEDK